MFKEVVLPEIKEDKKTVQFIHNDVQIRNMGLQMRGPYVGNSGHIYNDLYKC